MAAWGHSFPEEEEEEEDVDQERDHLPFYRSLVTLSYPTVVCTVRTLLYST